MDKPAVQGPSTVCETYLVNRLAQLLTCGINQSALSARATWSGPDWLYHSSLYIVFLVVNFLNIPCLSCNVIGASSKHIRSFPHSRFSWYARNCRVRPTLLWVPYQSSKCVTHNQNYVFWLAPNKYNFTLPLKRVWHLHNFPKFRLFVYCTYLLHGSRNPNCDAPYPRQLWLVPCCILFEQSWYLSESCQPFTITAHPVDFMWRRIEPYQFQLSLSIGSHDISWTRSQPIHPWPLSYLDTSSCFILYLLASCPINSRYQVLISNVCQSFCVHHINADTGL